MTLSKLDWVAFASYAAGGGLAAAFTFWALLDPKHAPMAMASGGLVIAVAGGLVRLFGQKQGAPSTAIVEYPKVVAQGTEVVHDTTPSVATNLTVPVLGGPV